MREATETWIEETTADHNALDLTGKTPGDIAGIIKQWREDEDIGFSAACDLLAGIEDYLSTGVVKLKPGQFAEDVYILLPREAATIREALEHWNEHLGNERRHGRGERGLTHNGYDPLDEVEIEILLEGKFNDA